MYVITVDTKSFKYVAPETMGLLPRVKESHTPESNHYTPLVPRRETQLKDDGYTQPIRAHSLEG